MKKYKIHIMKTGYLPLVFLIMLFLALEGCEKENTSPPVINRVRDIDPEQADIDLEGAGLGAWIVIQGENLASTQEIYFNEYLVYFNPAYVTETNIVIQIPQETPNIGTHPDAPNTIRVVNKYGEVTFDFTTFAPPAELEMMSYEFADPGDTLVLMGRYFFNVDSVIFPGELQAEILADAEDGSYCVVVVPEGATQPGPIAVVTDGGTGGSMSWSQYRDTVSIVKCNFDDINYFTWGCDIIADNGNFPGARGSFAHITASDITGGNNSWWDHGRSCNLDSISWFETSELSASPTKYLIKFEIFVPESWQTGSIMVDFNYNFGHMFRLQPWVVEGERVPFQTSSWITVYAPLTEFRLLEGLGEPPESIGDLVHSNGYARMALYHFNNGNTEYELPALHIDNFSIGIDNVRIIKME